MGRAKNKALPEWIKPGARVDYHARIGGPVTQANMVVADTWQLGDGEWVAKLEGKAGGVSVAALTLAENTGVHPTSAAVGK